MPIFAFVAPAIPTLLLGCVRVREIKYSRQFKISTLIYRKLQFL